VKKCPWCGGELEDEDDDDLGDEFDQDELGTDTEDEEHAAIRMVNRDDCQPARVEPA
jgi:hypothetical protein